MPTVVTLDNYVVTLMRCCLVSPAGSVSISVCGTKVFVLDWARQRDHFSERKLSGYRAAEVNGWISDDVLQRRDNTWLSSVFCLDTNREVFRFYESIRLDLDWISLYSLYAMKLWLNCQRISEVKQSELKCILRGKSVGFALVTEIVMAVVLCEWRCWVTRLEGRSFRLCSLFGQSGAARR